MKPTVKHVIVVHPFFLFAVFLCLPVLFSFYEIMGSVFFVSVCLFFVLIHIFCFCFSVILVKRRIHLTSNREEQKEKIAILM